MIFLKLWAIRGPNICRVDKSILFGGHFLHVIKNSLDLGGVHVNVSAQIILIVELSRYNPDTHYSPLRQVGVDLLEDLDLDVGGDAVRGVGQDLADGGQRAGHTLRDGQGSQTHEPGYRLLDIQLSS